MTKILAAMAAGLMLAACATTPPPPPPAPRFAVAVGEPQPLNGMVGSGIDVTVTNTGTLAIARVALSCQFFAADGSVVDTGASYFNNLDPGAAKTNRLMVTRTGAVRGTCAERAAAP